MTLLRPAAREALAWWSGNDLQFELGFGYEGSLIDVSNLATIYLELRPMTGNCAPLPSVMLPCAFSPCMEHRSHAFETCR